MVCVWKTEHYPRYRHESSNIWTNRMCESIYEKNIASGKKSYNKWYSVPMNVSKSTNHESQSYPSHGEPRCERTSNSGFLILSNRMVFFLHVIKSCLSANMIKITTTTGAITMETPSLLPIYYGRLILVGKLSASSRMLWHLFRKFFIIA